MVGTAALINTGLQAGDHARLQSRSRFNGFPLPSTAIRVAE